MQQPSPLHQQLTLDEARAVADRIHSILNTEGRKDDDEIDELRAYYEQLEEQNQWTKIQEMEH